MFSSYFLESTSSSSSNSIQPTQTNSIVVGGLLLGSSASVSTNSSMKSDHINPPNKPPLASHNNICNQLLTTPQQVQKQQAQTPSTLKNTNANGMALNQQTPALGLHKQLRYEDSPANIFSNQTCELGSFK